MENIVIIGNGISGTTLARHIRKLSSKKITIISDETEYFYSRTALMYVFMGHLKFEHTQPYENWFWKKNNINLIQIKVEEVDFRKKEIVFLDKEKMPYDKLVLATGSRPNRFGWKGQDTNGVVSLYSKQDLEKLELLAPNCKKAVVVGGGLIGIELVEMLISRNILVTFLVREKSFWNKILSEAESQIINRHIMEHHVDLRLDTNLEEIIADENGNVKTIVTDKGEYIDCTIVGLTVGVSPNIDFLKNSTLEIGRGVKVNRFLETNEKDVYAVGDCAEQRESMGLRRPVEAVWYTGRMMGETLAQTLCGKRMEYKPGHWFNSAKFFDIEYQTYGWVPANPTKNESHFYWEHKSGKKAIRIAYNSLTRNFIGINTLGVRMRHDFFNNALNENQTVDFVIKNLKLANFDPEFYKNYQKEILRSFQNY